MDFAFTNKKESAIYRYQHVVKYGSRAQPCYFPSKWSTGVIVPIYKKGDQYNPSNYRGITLTCTLSKLFTYILNERLLQFLSFHSLSSECQFAYKPGYSTIDAVYVLHSIIAHNMVKSDTHCAFIDFSKAFDKID